MKITISSGIIAATMLLAGCGKNNVSSDSPASPPKTPADAHSQPSTEQPSKTAQPPGDALIRQKLPGVWKPDPGSDYAAELDHVTVNADGTTLIRLKSDGTNGTNGETSGAAWRVDNGFFVVTLTNDDGSLDVESNKIIRIDDHEWVFQEDGETDLTTLRK